MNNLYLVKDVVKLGCEFGVASFVSAVANAVLPDNVTLVGKISVKLGSILVTKMLCDKVDPIVSKTMDDMIANIQTSSANCQVNVVAN